ncbi:hypothetical protein RFI_17368 [Reticulomyxa filosa]|uniref:Uncharacterized protein n=1 Tax=Reticulomyxa filosa TaxID=46433 RepID=X6N0R4_RETFI|nr:hypothetical protein RFI_17368 [Reticulomyxa filosa]|eukprot:ETO19860.1 hypothetical protein RFI_17368 [Reticulomyxa filosa]
MSKLEVKENTEDLFEEKLVVEKQTSILATIDDEYRNPTSPPASPSSFIPQERRDDGPKTQSEHGRFGFLLCPLFTEKFLSRISVEVRDKVYGSGLHSLTICYDGIPLQFQTPWLKVSFSMQRHELKTKKGTTYFKYVTAVDMPNVSGPTSPDDLYKETEISFCGFIEKLEKYLCDWGIDNSELLFTKDQLREFRNRQVRISDLFQTLIRPSKKGYASTIKISFPVTKNKVRITEGIFIEDCTTGELVEPKHYPPENLMDIRSGTFIKTYLRPTEIWSNKDRYGITFQATSQLAIVPPPPKKCELESGNETSKRRGVKKSW